MNRGSSIARAVAGVSRRSFNEAPIHESGKCESLTQVGAAPMELQ